MFEINNFNKFRDKIAIKFYADVNSPETIFYSDIIDSSILIQSCLENFLPKNSDNSVWNISNVAVWLPCHSPILLPAIIG